MDDSSNQRIDDKKGLSVIHIMMLQRQTRIDDDTGSLYDDATYDPATKLRFVFTSDTHNQTDRCNFQIPDGDVLLRGGDFTQV